jgi:hypothetical protein
MNLKSLSKDEQNREYTAYNLCVCVFRWNSKLEGMGWDGGQYFSLAINFIFQTKRTEKRSYPKVCYLLIAR